jgi:hypothetical protein
MEWFLDRVDNRRTMCGARNDAQEWVHKNQNNAHHCSTTMLLGLCISPSSCVDSHLALLYFSLRVFLYPSPLNHNERQEGNQTSSLTLNGGFFYIKHCFDTTAGTIKISTATRVPASPEVSSYRLCSPVFEQGGPSEKILMVDLSSDEEDLFPDTSSEEDFAKSLFGNLNCGLLGQPSDGSVIIINDSDEEEEAREEDAADADAAPSSTMKSPAPTTYAVDADDATKGVPDDSNGSRTPDQAQGNSSSGRDEVGSP